MDQLVSIITPTFNSIKTIRETWASLEEQTFRHWEWIVIDDGSVDDTLDYLSQLSHLDRRIRLIKRVKQGKGPSVCRNIGIKHAAGTYIFFLDSDDIIHPACLENRTEFMEKHPLLDFAVFPQATFRESIDDFENFGKIEGTPDTAIAGFLALDPPWCISGPFYRKNVFDTVHGFNEGLISMEDPEFHIRTLLAGLKYQHVPGAPDFFYRRPENESSGASVFWQKMIKGGLAFFKNSYNLVDIPGQGAGFLPSLQQGYKRFLKLFLMSRWAKAGKEAASNLVWAEKAGVLTGKQFFRTRIQRILSTNPLLRNLPGLKGAAYRWALKSF